MMFLARSKRVSRMWSPATQPTSTPSAEATRFYLCGVYLHTTRESLRAVAIDGNLILDIEQSLMKLSDAIGAAFLANNDRSDPAWEVLA